MSGIKLNFLINNDVLIIHTLSSMENHRFSSTKHKKDIVSFQNYAWRKSKSCYQLLVGRLSSEEIKNKNIQQICKKLPKFLKELEKSKQYRKILSQTKKYLNFCKNQWENNYHITSKYIKKFTGFKLNKKIDVFITHPSLKNGSNRNSNLIEWGHHEDWPNYTTVYLWNEILQFYIGRSDVEHAIVELIADEELRVRLNGGKYPPFVGHKWLEKYKKKILPCWKKYLKVEKHNINEFKKEMRAILCNKQET
ncbi:MAG: hypothetical protein QMD65_01600 [Patescibacteria group bacterium]|nr:hypothetical protein [Patescibacteria group bacterium]